MTEMPLPGRRTARNGSRRVPTGRSGSRRARPARSAASPWAAGSRSIRCRPRRRSRTGSPRAPTALLVHRRDRRRGRPAGARRNDRRDPAGRGRLTHRHRYRRGRSDLVQRSGTNRVGRLDTVVEAPDVTAPTISIVSPPDGSVLTAGEGMLANYGCEDEPGGSGSTKCDGPVANQTIVPNAVGAHTFTVTAEDAAHNVATASHTYVVFAGVRRTDHEPGGIPGRPDDPDPARARVTTGRPSVPERLSRVRQVHCATHEPIGPGGPRGRPGLDRGTVGSSCCGGPGRGWEPRVAR